MQGLRKFTFPLSILYDGVTTVRNWMYDKNLLQSTAFDIPVICVGNLSVGGTGKSPMIEYLLSLLMEKHRVAVLSRGYKRKTSGYLEVEPTCTAEEVGDEPLQFKRKFSNAIIAVDENRTRGITRLKEKADVILLDDAFQHRKVQASFSILLTTYSNLYTQDYLLPAGNLRESRTGSKRADIIVVTKCPDRVAYAEQQRIQFELQPNYQQQVYFTSVAYASLLQNKKTTKPLDFLRGKEFTLVTGVANPEPMVVFLKENGFSFSHLRFSDHHSFSKEELAQIQKKELVLTTEKDFMRLGDKLQGNQVFYLPIHVQFLNRETTFEQQILNAAAPQEKPVKN